MPEANAATTLATAGCGYAGYDVRCVIDVTAPGPGEAAREAQRELQDRDARQVFIVTELGGPGAQYRVEFTLAEPEVEVLRTQEEAELIAGTGLDTATGPGDPAAPANIRALRDALAEAQRLLSGPGDPDAEHAALSSLAKAAAVFTGDYGVREEA